MIRHHDSSAPKSGLIAVGFLISAASLLAAEAPVSTTAPSAQAPQGVKLEDKVVIAERETAAPDTTAMKLAATLHETPRSVTVVDSERIAERNYNSLDDAMDSTPGVFVNSRNASGYHFISRGFRMAAEDTRMDGFRGAYGGVTGQNALPLYGVEKVVFLKGPAGLFYGPAQTPGGMVNVIMRKPEEEQKTTLDFSTTTFGGNGVGFGDRAGFGAEFDSTGALSDKYLYRVGVAGDNTDGYTDDITNKSRFAQAAITRKLDKEGRLTFTPRIQHLSTENPAGAGMVVSPSSSLSLNDGRTRVNKDDLSSLNINLHEGGRTDELTVAGFDFAADKKDAVSLNAGYRYIYNDSDVNTWSPTGAIVGGQISRNQTKRQQFTHSHNFDVNATVENRPAADWKNKLTVGVNGRFTESDGRNAAGPLTTAQSPININTGAVGVPIVDRSTGWQPWIENETFDWNAYVQNQAAILDERLVLTTGVGYGQLIPLGGDTRGDTVNGTLAPNVAIQWNVTRDIAPYVAYATSYGFASPTTQYENAAGSAFTPDATKGDTKEIGLKAKLTDRKTNGTAAYFWAERTDVLTQSAVGDLNPNGNRYYFTVDGQKTEGLELAGSLYLTDDWHLDGSFAWITGSYQTGTPYDEPLAKTPEYSASVFSRHKAESGALKGFGHYIGVTWQDKRLGGSGPRTAAAPDPLMLPSFFRVDAGLEYSVTNRFKIGFHIYNLLDEVIVVDGTTGANIQVDAPRTYTLKASFTL